MDKTIAAFYRTRSEGEAALNALLAGGFTRNEVSFVSGDTTGHETLAVGPIESVGAETETERDAFIGGAVGMVAGAIATVIPGLGLLLLAGPLAGAIGGLTVGAAAGGIVGLLKDHGISKEEAEFYAEGVKRGGALVTVKGITQEREKQAQEILDQHHPIDTEELADQPSRR
jgi:hypothetical protein